MKRWAGLEEEPLITTVEVDDVRGQREMRITLIVVGDDDWVSCESR